MSSESENLSDDHTIHPQTELWRRVANDPNLVKYDEKLKCLRPTSAAFKRHPSNNAISVHIADIVIEYGLSAHDIAQNQYLVSLTAEKVRTHDLGIAKTPKPNDPSHADNFDKQNRSKTNFKEVQRVLAKDCEWEIGPSASG